MKKMMVIVKTLKGARFEIQVKPEDSVSDVKKKIEAVMGASAYPAEQQMLIHKGKVLKDGTTMEANNVADKSVIAITKSKPASTGASTASVGRKAQGIPEQSQEPAAGDPNAFYYLPEGLPSNGSLDFLRHTKQYQFLRPLVQSNPSLLKGILVEIKKQNPPLFRMMRENKADFARLIKGEPLEGGASGNQMAQPQELQDHHADLLRSQNNEPNDEGGDSGKQMEQSEEMEVQFTAEEYESIERLEAMGFERSDVVVVFFACNKNQDLAANYLLDHCHEFQ